MHQKSPVRNVYDLDAVDIIDGFDDLFVVVFAAGVDRDIANQKILSDADDIDALDVAASFADRCGYFAEFSWFVMNFDAKCNGITRVRC